MSGEPPSGGPLIRLVSGTPASPIDELVDEVVDLVNRAYRGISSEVGWTTESGLLGGQRVDAEMIVAALDDPRTQLLEARADGRLVACCEVRTDADPDAVELGMFATDPRLQGRGLGRQLLAHAERFVATDLGRTRVDLLVIWTRDELIAWYERLGYRRTGATRPFPYGDERYGQPVRDDLHFVVLSKALDQRVVGWAELP